MNTELIALRKLAEELDIPQIPSKTTQHGSALAMRKAADALEALQAENAQLKAGLRLAQASDEAWKKGWEAAQAEVANLKLTNESLDKEADNLATERDAALARLAELEKQEPVARLHITETDTYLDATIEVLNGERLQPGQSPISVYVAAGASPEPVTSKLALWRQACENRLEAMGDVLSPISIEIVRSFISGELAALAGASPVGPRQSAKHWHSRYIKKCQELYDEKARLGAEIETLELAAIDDAERYAVQPSQAVGLLDYEQKADIVSDWFSDEGMQSRAMQMLGDIEQAINARESAS